MTAPLMIHVNYADIRQTARVVTSDSDEWLSALTPVRADEAPAFGTDEFARHAATFHARTHARSMEYYGEVGDAAGDVGLGLVKMSNLYEAVEKHAVALARAIVTSAEISSEVGLL